MFSFFYSLAFDSLCEFLQLPRYWLDYLLIVYWYGCWLGTYYSWLRYPRDGVFGWMPWNPRTGFDQWMTDLSMWRVYAFMIAIQISITVRSWEVIVDTCIIQRWPWRGYFYQAFLGAIIVLFLSNLTNVEALILGSIMFWGRWLSFMRVPSHNLLSLSRPSTFNIQVSTGVAI